MNPWELLVIPVGWLGTNCYLFWDKESLDALIVDPGSEGKRLNKIIEEHHLNLKYIINTHGHGDHIAGNREVKKESNARLMIHEADHIMLGSSQKNLSASFGLPVTSPDADAFLTDGMTLQVGTSPFVVLETPGHSPGSICLKGEDLIFAGDTLFQNGVGRTDLPGGSHTILIESIGTKLMPLNGNLVVYPGHGPKTTLAQEKKSNPFL